MCMCVHVCVCMHVFIVSVHANRCVRLKGWVVVTISSQLLHKGSVFFHPATF